MQQVTRLIYIKPKNEIFARYLLSTRKQDPGETLDQFLQQLKTLAKDCNFKATSAEEASDDAIRDAFISGLLSCNIRQRLLENSSLDLQTAFTNARSLEMAEKQNLSYRPSGFAACTNSQEELPENRVGDPNTTLSVATSKSSIPRTNAEIQQQAMFCLTWMPLKDGGKILSLSQRL